MSNLIDFESKKQIDFSRLEKRKKMDKLLKKAQEKYEYEEKMKILQNNSILPEIHMRIREEEKILEKLQKPTSKKHKKEKSKKSKKKKHRNKSSSEDSEAESEWVEKTNNDSDSQNEQKSKRPIFPENCKLERQDWMVSAELDSLLRLSSTTTSSKKINQEEKMGHHSKELNPYWKDGGSGLPSSDDHKSNKVSTKHTTVSGDGGLAWWSKALKRCKELAEETGCSLEEVAAERYGSLETLKNRIKEAELFVATSNNFSSGGYGHKDQSRFKKIRYGDDNHKQQDQHRRSPRDNSKSFKGRDHREESGRCRWKKEDYKHKGGGHGQDDGQDGGRIGGRFGGGGNDKFSGKLDKENEMIKKDLNIDYDDHHTKELSSSSSSSSSESDDDKPKIDSSEHPAIQRSSPLRILSDEEKNKLSAKILKAELMGDEETVKILKKQLTEASGNVSHHGRPPGNQSQPNELNKGGVCGKKKEERLELLMMRTGDGGMRPYPERGFQEGQVAAWGSKKKKKQKVETHKDGKRMKYFHDDDQHSLSSLYEQEKLRKKGADEEFNMFNKLSKKSMHTMDNDDHTLDDEMLSKESQVKPSSLMESKQRQLAIIEQKKMSSRLDKCLFCFDATEKHLVVSLGTKVYLSLPRVSSMVEGHCLIVPMQHTVQCTACDEDVYAEIQTYKKSLVAMCQNMDKDIIFMETSKNLKFYPHLVVECIPVPREEGSVAPIYFKKAIMECESEWNQNKKLIDMKNRSLRQSIPVGLPYFHVSFGLDEGFGHVIENEKLFPHYFGREVLGGMLEVDSTLWRNPKVDSFEQQRIKVLNFSKIWKEFDHTLHK